MFPNLAKLKKDDRKLNIADITNIDNTDNINTTNNEFEIRFWNESTNKTNSNKKEEKNGNYKSNLERDKSKTEKTASSEIHKVEIK